MLSGNLRGRVGWKQSKYLENYGGGNKVQGIIEAETGILFEYDMVLLEKGLNSLSMISIVVKIEDEFSIEFEADALSYSVLKSIHSISQEISKVTNLHDMI